MNKSLDNLNWHDGNLAGISFAINKKGKSTLVIEAAFYKDAQAPSRDNYKIICDSVLKHNIVLSSKELAENMFAGNISNGYLKNNTLWVYFIDGVLEVTASKFRLSLC